MSSAFSITSHSHCSKRLASRVRTEHFAALMCWDILLSYNWLCWHTSLFMCFYTHTHTHIYIYIYIYIIHVLQHIDIVSYNFPYWNWLYSETLYVFLFNILIISFSCSFLIHHLVATHLVRHTCCPGRPIWEDPFPGGLREAPRTSLLLLLAYPCPVNRCCSCTALLVSTKRTAALP